ncbi:MAG: glycosyltransferase [Actinomycetota bacterium]|nr:glycosyltransferase [Actinomycetota bacterium]
MTSGPSVAARATPVRARQPRLGRHIKVLAIIDSFSLGGAERLLATLARAAPGAGLSLQVASLAPPTPERDLMLPVLEAAGLEVGFLGVRRLADPHAIPRLVRAIRGSGCDLVHAHLDYAAILATPAARLAGRPVVCSFHTMPQDVRGRESVKWRLAVAAAARASATIFVSEAARREFARQYLSRANWTVIANGLDLSEFDESVATTPPDLKIPPAAPLVTIVAAMRPLKGHADALGAWCTVVRQVPEARLLLVGTGEEESRLRALSHDLRIADRVIFAGVRRDIPRIMQASTLVLLPSRTEALPTTLIEAAACAKAVVATRVGGVPEVVEDGVSGLLVDPHDLKGLASAVVSLLLDPDRREGMARHARRLTEERFDMHRWTSRLRAVYERALEAGPADHPTSH